MATSESMKVLKSVCDDLGGSLDKYGFKYRKTNRVATRSGRLCEQSIYFGTSRSINSLDGHVHLEVRAKALNEDFGSFRRESGIELPINERVIFNAPIENLFREAPPYIHYDIGDEDERPKIIHKIKTLFEIEVMKMFDLVDSPSILKEYIKNERIPCLEPYNSIDHYLKFVGRHEE